MPTLNWIGKEAVVNHHRQVPFHLLKDVPDLACGEPGEGNLIVQGDNLVALKALLPYYAGQVKCIYIDPPYNTGNENWGHNDKGKHLFDHLTQTEMGPVPLIFLHAHPGIRRSSLDSDLRMIGNVLPGS